MIILDGSIGEGGGQILRSALALSTLTGQPFRIKNIRNGRKKPGLKAQHVSCINALQQLAGAKATDVYIGSTEILFIPGKIKAKNIELDIGSAGSITLLLQAILLPTLFSTRTHTITIIGGTDTKWSMSIDYFTHVVATQLRRFAGIEIKVLKRGYYPKGSGKVEIKIKPKIKRQEFETFKEFQNQLTSKKYKLEDTGKLLMIKGIAHASSQLASERVAERQALSAKHTLQNYNVPITIRHEYQNTLSAGSGITLYAIFSKSHDDIDLQNPIILGADNLGEIAKSPEETGQEVAKKLIQEIESGACVDSHLADNLIPAMGLAKGSVIRASNITSHTKTNVGICSKFLEKIYKIKDKTIKTTL